MAKLLPFRQLRFKREVRMTTTPNVFPADTPIRVNGKEYSRGQISRDTGLSISFISKLFSGQRSPSMKTLNLLATYFGVSMDQLTTLLAPPVTKAS